MTSLYELMHSQLALITLTFLVFWGARYLQSVIRLAIFNPMIVTIAVIIIFLEVTGISFDEYYKGGRLIEFWLKPAIVALALPLYNEMKHIRRQFASIFFSELAGCLVGLISVVVIARWLGASPEIIRSLAPKSVSTPIAIEISRQVGGIPALTSAIVIVVGMIGAVFGLKMMEWGHVRGAVSRSLSMGTAAHVMGTNRIGEFGGRFGAYATIGVILNGILTAFLAGPVIELLL